MVGMARGEVAPLKANVKVVILPDRLFQSFSWPELCGLSGRDPYLLARAGVSARSGLPFGHRESTKPSQRDSVSLFQLLGNGAGHAVYCLSRCRFGDFGLLSYPRDEFFLGHGLVPLFGFEFIIYQ